MSKPDGLETLHIMKDNKESKYDAMEIMSAYQERTGQHYDWHEFSNLLDRACQYGFIHIVEPGGWVVYQWGD